LESDEEEVEDLRAMKQIEEILAPHMREKPEVKGPTQKKALHSRSELVWNPRPHVRLRHQKEKNILDNQQLLAEGVQ
jgi:hypothetical protein